MESKTLSFSVVQSYGNMGQEIVCDYGNIDMEDDEDIPDLCFDSDVTFEKRQKEFVANSENDFVNSNGRKRKECGRV